MSGLVEFECLCTEEGTRAVRITKVAQPDDGIHFCVVFGRGLVVVTEYLFFFCSSCWIGWILSFLFVGTANNLVFA